MPIANDAFKALVVLCATHLSRPNAGMLVAAQTLVDAILELNGAKAARVAAWMKAEDLNDFVSYGHLIGPRAHRSIGWRPIMPLEPSADQARRAAARIPAKLRRARGFRSLWR